MVLPNLPSDDLPSKTPSVEDYLLRQQLDASLTQRFQQRCNPDLLKAIANCKWSISTEANVITLLIICPNRTTNWHVLEKVVELGQEMAQFSRDARVRIYSSPKMSDSFELRIDELAVYQEPS